MRALRVGAAVALSGCVVIGLSIQGCSRSGFTEPPRRQPVAQSGPHQKLGRPYVVNGQTFVPRHDENYDRVGTASYYGRAFHGRRTANGEIHDASRLTGAHKTLPLPSYVRVTNLRNGRSLIVRINDRGPFVPGRVVDVSRRAAKELGFLGNGLARVRVQYVGPTPL